VSNHPGMRTRLALAAATSLLLPLAGVALGHGGEHAPVNVVNGTSTGPVSSVAKAPGTAASRQLPDMAQLDPVRYSLEDAVVEAVEVPSRDGITTIWVDIIRPKTKPGVKVPVIMDASPYYNTVGRGYEGHCKTGTTELSTPVGTPGLGCSAQSAFPEFYDDYFVPRGYAVALMDLRGTRNTGGCQTYGDRDEVLDAVDVVDHLVEQPWSNGKVGLTGGSYDGTIATGVAVEQPISGRHKDAVGAVIPIRAIDRWYDYHFLNGVASSDHAATPALFTTVLAAGDNANSGTPSGVVATAQRKGCIATFGQATNAGYAPVYQEANNDFWSERDFAKDAAGTRTAFFLIHGLYDFNVKTNNVGQMWAALPKKAPKKMWLINGDHVDPDSPDAETTGGHILPFTFQKEYRSTTHRWWAQFLKGLPAGALDTATVEVQGDDGRWLGSRSWPLASKDQVLGLRADGKAAPGDAPAGSVSWSDEPTGESAPASQSFVTAPVKRATRLSGQVVFDLAYTLTGPDTTLAVRIEDLPPGAADDSTDSDPVLDSAPEDPFTVSYGWARAAYRGTIEPRGLSTPHGPEPVIPGETVRTAFGSLPLDFTVRPGHRLRFTFSASDGGTVAGMTGGEVALQLGKGLSTVRLPIAR
jgi:X-Pro dipeptidyl-peptidase